MEKQKEIFVIRPTEGIDVKTIERNPNKLQTAYDLGVADCRNQLEQLCDYLR